jgi:hypothetical protein
MEMKKSVDNCERNVRDELCDKLSVANCNLHFKLEFVLCIIMVMNER